MIATSNGEFKFAKSLNREDVIVTYDFINKVKLEEKIESILIEPVEGYAAPLTMSGTLLVDGILASSYAVIESHSLAHAAMSPVRLWYKLQDKITSEFLTSMKIKKQVNGTHWYPGFLHSLANNYLDKVVQLH